MLLHFSCHTLFQFLMSAVMFLASMFSLLYAYPYGIKLQSFGRKRAQKCQGQEVLRAINNPSD